MPRRKWLNTSFERQESKATNSHSERKIPRNTGQRTRTAKCTIQHEIRLGLSEIRKHGEAIIEKPDGDIFNYIGETKGQKGVGFMIKKQLKYNIPNRFL
mgnify:CR=1 FL=1